jgi:hypothetical protein
MVRMDMLYLLMGQKGKLELEQIVQAIKPIYILQTVTQHILVVLVVLGVLMELELKIILEHLIQKHQFI